MKSTVLFIFLFLCCQLFSQSDAVTGDYYVQLGHKDSRLIEYRLTLNEDGSFSFHAHSKSSEKIGIPEESNEYGRGSWALKERKVLFYTNPEKDIDQKYTLNFANTRAHFMSKSPRSKSDAPFKTRLKFFESGIFWIEGLEIFKR